MLVVVLLAGALGQPVGAQRSDGSILHVDFENHIDEGVGFLNAGVRWVGYPFSEIKQKISAIVVDPNVAFGGSRCGYVWTDRPEQRGRITLQPRADQANRADAVAEFVFRPVSARAVAIEDFVVWSAEQNRGGAVGVVLFAHGSAASGTYALSVKDARRVHRDVVRDLLQTEWVRILIHRNRSERKVSIAVGPPGREKAVGEFEDINAQGDVARVELGDISETGVVGSGHWDDVRIGQALAGEDRISPPEPRSDVRGEVARLPSPVLVGREKQLFVDSLLVQTQQNLKRTFHPVTKFSKNPLIVPDSPWESKSIIALGRMQRDVSSGLWRYWYGAWGKQIGQPTFECLAESNDGITWLKPRLGLQEFAGSKANNIVREGRMFGVRFDGADPDPARRYKAIIRDAGFLLGYSPDGLRWRTTRPVLDQAYDATSVSWDPVEAKWIASCKIWYQGRRVRGYAESRDFETWTDTALSLTHDEADGAHDQLYHLAIGRYESVYVGLLKIYHTDTDRCDIQLAFSRNAKQWSRPDRSAFIPNGRERGSWDYGNLDQPDGWHVVGDEMWFYYGGRSTLHNESPNDGSIGLAKLRLDGFVSLDAGDQPGVLITQPVVLKGRSLFVNADARGGSLKVEIVDAHNTDASADISDPPVYPFHRGGCVEISGDSVRHEVRWADVSGFESLREQPVRLKFYLTRARLYAFWSE